MALDPAIPLSVRPPQIDSPSEAIGRVLSLQQLHQQIQQGQALEQERRLKIAEQQRTLAGRSALTTILNSPDYYDPATKRVIPEKVANELSQRGFTDLAEGWLKQTVGNREQIDKWHESETAHADQTLETIGSLAATAKSATEFDAGVAAAAANRIIDQKAAERFVAEADQAGPDGWKTFAQKYVQLAPSYRKAALQGRAKLQEPVKLGLGETVQIPATGQTVASGGPPKLDEWQSFQQSYAKGFGKTWTDLSPAQQMAGFSTFAQQKQSPEAAEMAKLRTTLLGIQIGQQPTKEDAAIFGRQLVEHKIAPSQVQIFGGFGGQGAAFKRMVGAEALKLDPSFDWEQAESEYQLTKSLSFQNTVRYMDSVTESIPRLEQNAVKLANGQFKTWNAIKNAAASAFNDKDVKAFKVDAVLVGDEIAKILQGGGTGSGTSDAKLKQAQDLISTSDNVPAIAAAIDEVNYLIGNRRRALTRGTYMEHQAPNQTDTTVKTTVEVWERGPDGKLRKKAKTP